MARKRRDNGHRGDMDCGFRDKPIQRNAANARERARMRVLSKAFSRLKTTLPMVPQDTKLSKLDTLKLATYYIAHLRQILVNDSAEGSMIPPINLTWPFTFNASRSQEEDSLNSGHNVKNDTGPCSLSADLMDLGLDYSPNMHQHIHGGMV